MPCKSPKAAALLLLATAGPATAQSAQIVSIYTSTAPKDCRVLRADREVGWGTRACKGPAGLAVVISEDDLRETVSAARTVKVAETEPAARTWFGPFSSTSHTIEWRTADKTKRPFAMIQRWHLADNDDTGKDNRPIAKPMLVVTRLPPGKVCHVAYIDVQANADANELARKAADEIARDFVCGTDSLRVIGNSGRAVELARPD
ncbi:MAG: hypothetical protein J0I29_01440 [Rhizobiales bacterium]|nr:hypothetical protein [Hyphomicrobiales bacterium]